MRHPFFAVILFCWRLVSAPLSKDFDLKAAVLRFVYFLRFLCSGFEFYWMPLTPSRFKSLTPKSLISERISSTLLLPSSPLLSFRTCPSALRCCKIPFLLFPLPRAHTFAVNPGSTYASWSMSFPDTLSTSPL